MKLEKHLDELGISLKSQEVARLQEYVSLLEQWSARTNLTALRGDPLLRRLIAEPLWVAQQLGPTGRYLDIGSGSGSPALPWCIAQPFTTACLLEPRVRRAVFLQHVIRRLDLTGVTVCPVRLENWDGGWDGTEHAPPDWITLQGVRLTAALWAQIAARSGEATQAVWLTRSSRNFSGAHVRMDIPGGDRCALVFSPTRTSPDRD